MTCAPASWVGQLRSGYPTAHVDCGVVGAEVDLRHALCDQIDPTPPELRARGHMGTGPTGGAGWKRAVDSYGPEAAALGFEPPVLLNAGFIDKAAIVAQLAQKRAMLQVGVRYAVLQDHPEWHAYRGSTAYRGLHSINARGLWRKWGTGLRRVRYRNLATLKPWVPLWTEVLDPIADGRRPIIPQGPQKWPLELLLAAGDAASNPGDGLVKVHVIYRAKRLQP